jgi:chemotaxis protein CheD
MHLLKKFIGFDVLMKNLIEINNPKKLEHRLTIQDIKEASFVFMSEFGFSKYGVGKTQYVKTCGLGPCVGIVLYDSVNKVGGIAHFTTKNEVNLSLMHYITMLLKHGAGINSIVVRIIGGSDHLESKNMLTSIIKFLLGDNIFDMKFSIIEFDTGGNKTRNILLDVESGVTYNYKPRGDFLEKEQLDYKEFQSSLGGILNFNETNIPNKKYRKYQQLLKTNSIIS